MTEQQRETRPPTTAEVHAARALGRPNPWEEIEVEATPAAVRLAGRIQPVRESAKPKGMSSADWYGQRVRERNAAERAAQAAAWGTGTEPAAEETEAEVEEEPQAPAGGIRVHGSWGFRPSGAMFLRTDGGPDAA